MKLYLDGCSLTYGQGLDREHSLGRLFADQGEYEVLDYSRPAKSNMVIALDTYQHRFDADVFVLGFTFSARFGIKYRDQNLNFFSGFRADSFDLEPMALYKAHLEIQKYFFAVFDRDYYDQLSDMLIDATVRVLPTGKKVLAFSWETRKTDTNIVYPFIPPNERLPDGHLDQTGTRHLYDYLQQMLDG